MFSTSSPVSLREVYIVVCDSFRLRFEGLSQFVAICCNLLQFVACVVYFVYIVYFVYFVYFVLSGLCPSSRDLFLQQLLLVLPFLLSAVFACLNACLEDPSGGCRERQDRTPLTILNAMGFDPMSQCLLFPGVKSTLWRSS